jgi:hypothetical protein
MQQLANQPWMVSSYFFFEKALKVYRLNWRKTLEFGPGI